MWYGFGNYKSPFVNISCHLQGEKLPDFNAFPDNLHWRKAEAYHLGDKLLRKDSKFFPACWILIGQFNFPARKPHTRAPKNALTCVSHVTILARERNFHLANDTCGFMHLRKNSLPVSVVYSTRQKFLASTMVTISQNFVDLSLWWRYVTPPSTLQH